MADTKDVFKTFIVGWTLETGGPESQNDCRGHEDPGHVMFSTNYFFVARQMLLTAA
jgi:hypothetical protein